MKKISLYTLKSVCRFSHGNSPETLHSRLPRFCTHTELKVPRDTLLTNN